MCVPILLYKQCFFSGKDMYVHDMYLTQCMAPGVCKMLVQYLLCLCLISMNERTLKRPSLGEVIIKYIYQNVKFLLPLLPSSFSSFISVVTSEYVEKRSLVFSSFLPF